MGKITKLRPNGYKTEGEAWDEDTAKLSFVELQIKNKNVSENNYFSLCSKIIDVEGRTSLDGHDPKYYDRMVYCKKLRERVNIAKEVIEK